MGDLSLYQLNTNSIYHFNEQDCQAADGKRTISPQSRYHENRFRPSRSCSTVGSLRQNTCKWAKSCWIVFEFRNTDPSHHPVCVQELLSIVVVMQSEKIFLYRKCQANSDVIWKNPPQWIGIFVETLFEGTFRNWAAVHIGKNCLCLSFGILSPCSFARVRQMDFQVSVGE